MLYSCPNHELSREMIIQKKYDRLYLNDRTMLDTSCASSYMMKTIEFSGTYWIELNTTLKIGIPTMVRSQV